MPKLTSAQRESLKEVLEGGYRKIDSIKNPVLWHQFVHHYNWDDGLEPISWICSRKKCDLGTALMAYWLAEPEHYAAFASREDAEAADAAEGFDLVRAIEARVAKGFYKNQVFAFDPGSGFADVSATKIPEVMKAATPGEPFDEAPLDTVSIRPLNEKQRRAIDREVKKAWKFLGKEPSSFSNAESLLDAIELAANTHRQKSKDKKEKRKMRPLGVLWMVSAAEVTDWELLAWDWETGADVMLFSPDRSHCMTGEHMIEIGYEVLGNVGETYTRRLFEALPNIEELEGLFSYIGMGIVKMCAHLPYKPNEE